MSGETTQEIAKDIAREAFKTGFAYGVNWATEIDVKSESLESAQIEIDRCWADYCSRVEEWMT